MELIDVFNSTNAGLRFVSFHSFSVGRRSIVESEMEHRVIDDAKTCSSTRIKRDRRTVRGERSLSLLKAHALHPSVKVDFNGSKLSKTSPGKSKSLAIQPRQAIKIPISDKAENMNIIIDFSQDMMNDSSSIGIR
jgi:hypothetical protein